MRTIQIQGYGEKLKLNQTPELEVADDEVLISIKSAGVNPVDTYIVAGSNGYSTCFPHTPGKDGAGVVTALGANVSNFNVGDRVYCSASKNGTCAEFALADSTQVFPLSGNLSFEQGACLGTPYATAWRSLFIRANCQAGETVFIHGASGGVGLAALQLAKAAGCKVFASASTEQGRELLTQQGADLVVDHNNKEHYQIVQQAGPVDIVLEMLANINLGDDLPLLNFGGRVVVIGSRGHVEINPRDLMSKDACVMGMSMANTSSDQRSLIHNAIFTSAEKGEINPVIAKRFTLENSADAHLAVMESGATGNIVINI